MVSIVVADRTSRMLGGYQLVAELARGGMGRVYLGRRSAHGGFERLVAIKVMHHQLAQDEGAVLMLLDEAHIASRVHHPNVVPVIDMGTYDDGHYLVMDYVEGCSLHDLLRRDRTHRDAGLIVPIILEALHGLHAVHTLKNEDGVSYGIVHRDVSPHNLLVGLDGVCRVIDFGIAKAAARFSETQAGMYKGKLPYMAPEQLTSDSPDARADVWAAGVTLYQALTGKQPFRGENDAATLHRVLAAPIEPPSTIGLRAPACLDAVILKALSRDVSQRYRSAQEFAEALRKVALANDLLAAPSEIAAWVEEACGEDLSKRRRRIKLVHDADHTAGNTPSMPRLWNEGPPVLESAEIDLTKLDEPSPSPKRSSRAPWIAAACVTIAIAGAGTFYGAHALQHTSTTATAPRDPIVQIAASSAPPAAMAIPEVAAPVEAPPPAAPVVAVAEPAPIGPAPRRRPFTRRTAAPVARAPVARAPVARAPAVAAPEPQPPPQPVAPPEQRVRTMDRNPYLRGE
jgi:serine/threonine protein kinase